MRTYKVFNGSCVPQGFISREKRGFWQDKGLVLSGKKLLSAIGRAFIICVLLVFEREIVAQSDDVSNVRANAR